jgi:hypothetical protein
MAKKSAKPGRGSGFQIQEPEPALSPIDLENRKLASLSEGVSVSLKYYRKSTECFSEWEKSDLKKFSDTVDKIAKYNSEQLKSHKPLCVPHRNDPASARFGRPDTLSPELRFFEVKVDPSNKLRIHGPIVGSVFFLVWLDREHAVFPE